MRVEQFGVRIRRLRKNRTISLRAFAEATGVSASYLHRIETAGKLPAEGIVRTMASELDADFDELMAMAGRVAADVQKLVIKDLGMPAFLRAAKKKKFSAEKLMTMISKKK